MRGGSSAGATAATAPATATAIATVTVVLALTMVGVVSTDVSAHRRDEYLQAARLAIAPDRVELQLDLTPGIAVAGAIIADIDGNRDDLLSPGEQQAYAGRVLNALSVDIDGQPVPLQLAASRFPDVDAFRRGEGTIELRLQPNADLPPLSEGAHQLSYRNTHRRDVGVYLANALVPDSDRVSITAQLRDTDQRDLTITYVVRDGPETSLAHAWLLGWIAAAAVLLLVMLRSSRTARASRGCVATGP
jgi:hypothetical protein